MVDVIRYAVVTHACELSPCRSSAIVRIEVLTMVWSSAARNIPSIRPLRIVMIWRCVSLPAGADGAIAAVPPRGGDAGVVMRADLLASPRHPGPARLGGCCACGLR